MGAIEMKMSDGASASEGFGPSTAPTLLFDLWLLTQASNPLVDRAIHGSGISVDEFGLYVLLEEYGPVTPGRISEITGMRANTISASLRRLDGRGHIRRSRNDRDGRSVIIELTPEGQAQINLAKELKVGLIQRIYDGIDVGRIRSALMELDNQIRVVGNMPELHRYPTEEA